MQEYKNIIRKIDLLFKIKSNYNNYNNQYKVSILKRFKNLCEEEELFIQIIESFLFLI